MTVHLGRGESETGDALQLADERVETARDAVGRHEGLQRRLVARLRRREQPAAGGRAQERRPLALGALVEPIAEHLGEQLILEDVAIAAHRSLIPRRPEIAETHHSIGALLIRDDGITAAGMLGYVEHRPWPLGLGILDRGEVRANHRGDGVLVHVADDNHRHQVRPVPVAIEAHQLLALRLLNHRRIADGRSVRVTGSLQLDFPQFVRGPLVGAQIAPPLGEDDGALALDGGVLEKGAARPVLEHGQRPVEGIERARPVGRHAQQILGLVEARHRVRVRADAEADRPEEGFDALTREVTRSLELHVLDEVREATLVIVLQHRSGADDQPHFGLARGLGVRADVEAEAVGQAADQDLGIDRHVGRQRVARHRRGRGGMALGAGRDLSGRRTDPGGDEDAEQQTRGRAMESFFDMPLVLLWPEIRHKNKLTRGFD